MIRRHPAALSAALVLMLLAAAPAGAQKVYRCGPEGREYSQTPCPAGREVDAADPRSAEQQREAQAAAANQARLAKELAAERHEREREAAARAQGPAAIRASALAPATSGEKSARPGQRRPPKKPAKPKADKVTWQAASPQR